MQDTTQDISNGYTNVEQDQANKAPLITNKPWGPFVITTNEQGSIIRLADYRLTEICKTEDELYDLIANPTWEFNIAVISAIIAMEKRLSEKDELVNLSKI
ncbi:hypothetical protein [Antarctic microvirus TYR_006_V_SP_13]|nr:hypothetical protein [Antarctic microvirus TYR_006_V_SP_13]